MQYKENKISNFFKGRGFYLVLAGSLLAIGIASWSALSMTREPEPTPDKAPSYTASEDGSSTETPTAGDKQDEPYSSQEESSAPQPAEPPKTEIVADKFEIALDGSILKEFSSDTLTYSATFGDMRLHSGIDISGEKGQDVKSCGKGFITAVINDALFGNYVEIDHGNGIVARYCGLDQNILVEEGDTVELGSKIGTLGEIPAECADNFHLHLEFFKDEVAIDPMSILNKAE